MATELKAASEEVKVDLFEDDDEFEEFEINEVPVVQDLLSFSQMNVNVMQRAGNPVTDPILTAKWEVKEGKEITQQWEDDWDDDDVNDDFSLQLKRELENNAEKK